MTRMYRCLNHHQNAKLCLEAGKPVLCEKSFTTNANEAEELVNLSRSKGVFLMEALWTRFLPIYEQVRKWLDTGKIGNITLVTSTLGFVAPRKLLPDFHLSPRVINLSDVCIAKHISNTECILKSQTWLTFYFLISNP